MAARDGQREGLGPVTVAVRTLSWEGAVRHEETDVLECNLRSDIAVLLGFPGAIGSPLQVGFLVLMALEEAPSLGSSNMRRGPCACGDGPAVTANPVRDAWSSGSPPAFVCGGRGLLTAP
ncbi:hypothetical protein GCM10010336_50710 [Streptomyces goshikiensis]|nr:hypothetical protein GCM10010336_50710 [Streptomyces goshikiensis]